MLVVFVGIIPLAPNVSRNANGLGRTDVNGDEPGAARKDRLTFARLTSGWLAGPCRLVTRERTAVVFTELRSICRVRTATLYEPLAALTQHWPYRQGRRWRPSSRGVSTRDNAASNFLGLAQWSSYFPAQNSHFCAGK